MKAPWFQAEIEIVIQINGRVRDRMCVPKGEDPEYLRPSSRSSVDMSTYAVRPFNFKAAFALPLVLMASLLIFEPSCFRSRLGTLDVYT